jgi:hypothetical protein
MNIDGALQSTYQKIMDNVKLLIKSGSELLLSNDQFEFISKILKERMNGSFTLRLLFRGTRDGMTNAKFH